MSSDENKRRTFNESGNSDGNSGGIRGRGTQKVTKDKFNEDTSNKRNNTKRNND